MGLNDVLKLGHLPTDPCDTCGVEVTKDNRHHAGVWFRGLENTRLYGGIWKQYRFCSHACMREWWRFGRREPFRVDSPATITHEICAYRPEADFGCFNAPIGTPVAVGEVITHREGNKITVEARDHTVLKIVEAERSSRPDGCPVCHDTGTISVYPHFKWSSPDDPLWQPHWADQKWDDAIGMVFWELPGTGQILAPENGYDWIQNEGRAAYEGRLSPVEAIRAMPRSWRMPLQYVRGMAMCENPHQVNEIWTQPIDIVRIMTGFEAEKAKVNA